MILDAGISRAVALSVSSPRITISVLDPKACKIVSARSEFAISILNAHDISIKKHGERINRGDIESALSEASDNDPIDPLSKLLAMEKKKNAVLVEQYEILSAIRPMIPADVLELQAAESVVGQNYIWGCKQWRENHEDLPSDFKLSDVVLPVFIEETGEMERQQA